MMLHYYMWVLCVLHLVSCLTENYEEALNLRPLASNRQILAHFNFTVTRDKDFDDVFSLFASVVGDVMSLHNVDEVHLSLTQGHWRHSQWGDPPYPPNPTGAQLWAYFGDRTDECDIDGKYSKLVHTLSGLFCASLQDMYPTLTTTPFYAVTPTGVYNKPIQFNRIRYSIHANENVCTENLAPWKKLLPCKTRGLSQLLNPLKLIESSYYSIALNVDKTCPGGTSTCSPNDSLWRLTQTITAVFNANPKAFRLSDIFDVYRTEVCPISHSAKIVVHDPQNNVELHTYGFGTSNDGQNTIIDLKSFDTKAVAVNDRDESLSNFAPIEIKYDNFSHSSNDKNVMIYSYISGTGQHYGWLTSLIVNRNAVEIRAIHTHIVPAYLRLFLHSITFNCANKYVTKPKTLQFIGGKSGVRPYIICESLRLPANSSCELLIKFEKCLLRWTQYPPDAHRGFVIAGPQLTFIIHNYSTPCKLHGEPMLVTLPTPDFSMPYNVICLVCTVVALAFGPIHNLTTKSLVLLSDSEESGFVNKFKDLKSKLKNKIVSKLSWNKAEIENNSDNHEKNE